MSTLPSNQPVITYDSEGPAEEVKIRFCAESSGGASGSIRLERGGVSQSIFAFAGGKFSIVFYVVLLNGYYVEART